MEASDADYYTNTLYGLKFVDRRKKTLTNRLRRCINNYWVIPVFILYLELFAIILPPVDSPVTNLKDRNLYFLRGSIVLYNLVSTDFPHVLLGHFKEICVVKKYTFNIDQVPSEDIVRGLEDRESTRRIYRRVIESRGYDNTELGGVAFLVYGPQGPRLSLYEIISMNRVFSERLHSLGDSSIEDFLSFIQRGESRELLTKVGIDEHITDNLIAMLSSSKHDKDQKMTLIKNFIKTYDIHSESKYILSPYDFKSFLGKADMAVLAFFAPLNASAASEAKNGKYIGIFHFHNNYMEPPSEVDVANSYNDRQIVITLGDRGIVIYDIIKGKEIIYKGDLIS